LTPLHFHTSNRLYAQIVGRELLVLLPPSETPKLYNSQGTLSEIEDLLDPGLDHLQFPRTGQARRFEIQLNPGDILFIPTGWWCQARALELSGSALYTEFIWPNEFHHGFPLE
jgi:lysine-specific demethylase 8